MKKFLQISLFALIIACLMLNLFVYADGSGVNSNYVGAHNGYNVSIYYPNSTSSNNYSFNNHYVPGTSYDYDQTNSHTDRYVVLDSTYFPPYTESVGQIMSIATYGLWTNQSTTITFNAFVPYFLGQDDYLITWDTPHDVDVSYDVLAWGYDEQPSTAFEIDHYTFNYQGVTSVEILKGYVASTNIPSIIDNLTITIHNHQGSYEWFEVHFPIVEPQYEDILAEIEGIDTAPVEETIEIGGLFDWVDDFFSVNIFGDISLGNILAIIVAISVVVWFLKVTSGG